jgi:phage shock protein C
MNNGQRLWRSEQHRMIAGVCGGIAEWLGWTPLSVRVLYVLVSVCSAAFPGIIAYLILWFVMPRQLPLPADGIGRDATT